MNLYSVSLTVTTYSRFHNLVLKPNVIITCIMVWFYSFSIPMPFIFSFCNLICFDLYWIRGDAHLPLYMGFRTQVKILDSAHNKQNNSPYLGSHPVNSFRMIYILIVSFIFILTIRPSFVCMHLTVGNKPDDQDTDVKLES